MRSRRNDELTVCVLLVVVAGGCSFPVVDAAVRPEVCCAAVTGLCASDERTTARRDVC